VENAISNLSTSYENGGIARRDIVRGLAVLATVSGSINRVSLYVSDPKRPSESYQRVFASSAQNRPDGTVAESPAAKVDHFTIGSGHFNKDSAIADLNARGTTPLEQGDAAFHVMDPDGYTVQLSSDAA